MDFGAKLEELQLTTDEIDRFSKALKDEKFRSMLHEYAEEISNPENKKKYEEEITQLEQERGWNVEFVHPKPHHVLKTSVNGKEKCFINICSNDLINKPTCKAGTAQDGSLGQHWSLPYSLAPGRYNSDAKGNKCTIYDVVFHPDTLYIARKNMRFMKLVNSTATQGVEDAFKVKLDKIDTKVLKINYKGLPHPAVIRNPIPSHPGKEKASSDEERFSIPYPDTAANERPKALTAVPLQDYKNLNKESSSASQQPTKPLYTIKYRSVVDLQDYRCSRDSVRSSRPKDIVITVDLPLIRSAGDIDLNVTERSLVLESQRLTYKLELQFSYPVDDEKGDVKFNKATKQLIITLPVLPFKEPAMIHVEGKQIVSDEEERDEMESADKAEGVLYEAVSLDKDEQNNTNLSDFSCTAQCFGGMLEQDPKREHQFSSDWVESKTDCLESHCDAPLCGKAIDSYLKCEGMDSETCRMEEGNTNDTEVCSLSGPDFCTLEMPSEYHSKEEADSCDLKEERENHTNVKSTTLSIAAPVTDIESATHSGLHSHLLTSAEIEDVSQSKHAEPHLPEISVMSHSKNVFHDIPNDPTSPSQQLVGKSAAELPVVSFVPSQLNFTLGEEATKPVSFPVETGVVAEVQMVNSSPEQISPAPGHKESCEFSFVVKETEVQLLEELNSVHSSEQGQTGITNKTPVILREKNPEDGSEVIIRDHTTSSALSFQNSLWFELD